jgi:hypothetical protein
MREKPAPSLDAVFEWRCTLNFPKILGRHNFGVDLSKSKRRLPQKRVHE